MALRTRAALIATIALALVMVPVGSATASGGGGCGKPVTNEAGSEVGIRNFCFTPTVLYTQPGETVTWTNQDGFRHNVLGANAAWGSFASLRTDKTASFTFSDPGVYAYVCTMHPGMVGTVVVGEPAPGEPMDARSVRKAKLVSATSGDVVDPAAGDASNGSLWLGVAVTVAALGALAVGRRVRRRSRS